MTLLLTLFASIPLWLILLIWIGLTFVCLKRYGVKARTWYRCWGIALLVSSCVGIPRQDYLECNLPNGDQFILTNTYAWAPLVHLMFFAHDIASSNRQSNHFDTYYKPRGISGWGWQFTERIDADADGSCYFNFVGGYFDTPRGLMVRQNNQLERVFFPPNDNFPASDELYWELSSQEEAKLTWQEASKIHTNDLEKRELTREKIDSKVKQQYAKQYGIENKIDLGYQWFGKVGNKLWREIELRALDGFCNKDSDSSSCPITAAWQAYSTDNGKTWSAPIITKNANLFIIGKSRLDQPFFAKPGKWIKGPR